MWLNGIIYTSIITGGYDEERNGRKEIVMFDGEDWTEVGVLQKPRHWHADTVIEIDDNLRRLCNINTASTQSPVSISTPTTPPMPPPTSAVTTKTTTKTVSTTRPQQLKHTTRLRGDWRQFMGKKISMTNVKKWNNKR